MNNNYRTLTKALEVMGFKNSKVHCNVVTVGKSEEEANAGNIKNEEK